MRRIGGIVGALVIYSQNRTLQTLLKGLALEMGLTTREIHSGEEWPDLLEGPPPTLLVMGVEEIKGEHLALARDYRARFGIPLIIVAEKLASKDAAQAAEAGATTCLSFEDAMNSLVFIAHNVLKDSLHISGYKKHILSISDRVTLSVPDYSLTDGEHEVRLSSIPGALLECLALNPNRLVPTGDLILNAWGSIEAATSNALRQQIYHVRERLSEYGLNDQLKSVHGRGYILRSD